jgi:hypothetical protein
MCSSPDSPSHRFILSLERARSGDDSDNYIQKSPTPFLPFVEYKGKGESGTTFQRFLFFISFHFKRSGKILTRIFLSLSLFKMKRLCASNNNKQNHSVNTWPVSLRKVQPSRAPRTTNFCCRPRTSCSLCKLDSRCCAPVR